MQIKIKKSIAVSVSLIVVIGALGLWSFNATDKRHSTKSIDGADVVPKEPEQPKLIKNTRVEGKLHVQAPNIKQEITNETFRLDVEFIFSALSQLRLDDNDQIILDNTTKDQLVSAFSRVSLDLKDSELDELSALIQMGVRGPAGEEAAHIVRSYYDYRMAEAALLEMIDTKDIQSLQGNFDQIVEMRIAHLGYNTANALFSEEQKQQQYMIDSMRIQNNQALSEKEKQAQQDALAQRFEHDIY